MTTLMIIGAGPLQIPAYLVARQMGLRIVALDRSDQAPGMRLADSAHAVDTRDAAGAVEVARRERVDGVMTLCTDFPVRTVAAVASSLGLPGPSPEIALRATHKGLMRVAFEASSAPSPRYARVRDEQGALGAAGSIGYPVVVKPTSSSGSRGVFKVTREGQISEAFAHAQAVDGPGSEVLVEEFVDGPEVSVEVISWRGRHQIIAITDKVTSGDPHWVELGHSQPSRLPREILEAIRSCTGAGLDALGIRDSPSHVEIKVGKRGPVLIEIGARLGGDYISTELTRLSTGVCMPRAAIDIALGREPSVAPGYFRASAIRYIVPRPGTVTAISGVAAARNVSGVAVVEVHVKPGEIIHPVRSSSDRAGHVITAANGAEEAIETARRAVELVQIDVSGDEAGR